MNQQAGKEYKATNHFDFQSLINSIAWFESCAKLKYATFWLCEIFENFDLSEFKLGTIDWLMFVRLKWNYLKQL